MAGFHEIDDYAVLTSDEVAARLGYGCWREVSRWLQRTGLPRPPRIMGTHKFRGRELKTWLAALPTDDQAMAPPEPVSSAAPPSSCEVVPLHDAWTGVAGRLGTRRRRSGRGV